MSADPDPTGIFSLTEYDIAVAKGLVAPQPPPAEPGDQPQLQTTTLKEVEP